MIRYLSAFSVNEHDICSTLQDLRKYNGLTLDELARKVGVNKSTLSQYENGKITPPLNKLVLILNLLGAELMVVQYEDEE